MLVEGKVALITGGARGIGRAIAEELLRHGAKVCLVDVLKNELSQTESELKKEFGEDSVITSIADITKEEQFTVSFEQSVSKFGKIDILVNNASIQKEGLWETMLSINLGGTIRGTLLAMKFMNPETGGVVVNMSSISGVNVTHGQMPLIPVYSTAKAAVIAYTRCFALNKEVIDKKIRLVCLCPRSTDTVMLKDTDPDKCWDVDAFYSVDRGRLMTASEVAVICKQLIEDDTNGGKVALIEGVNQYKFI
ncbi:15-hydroxyprostaglandin dehydrogenase [NAD(+)]-like isoform X1 [Liolophura sinensis]|uniref:15-hydroxyprostaglandin dehydrogenase [NAD(+)]-like isoform X1 n=1 Tax=Liolophura sinensis TaxID=3198878 RepID=UPI003158AC9D